MHLCRLHSVSNAIMAHHSATATIIKSYDSIIARSSFSFTMTRMGINFGSLSSFSWCSSRHPTEKVNVVNRVTDNLRRCDFPKPWSSQSRRWFMIVCRHLNRSSTFLKQFSYSQNFRLVTPVKGNDGYAFTLPSNI